MTTIYPLSQLGWTAFFQQQLTLDEWTETTPARVMAQHRSQLTLCCEQGSLDLPVHTAMPPLTTGDWLLLNPDGSFHRALERRSVFSRKAAGSKVNEQLIAANVDTVFIATALNHNFNLNRIERYLALTREAGAEAVVVLTQADLCDNPEAFRQQVQALDPMLMVETVNALGPQQHSGITPLVPYRPDRCTSGLIRGRQIHPDQYPGRSAQSADQRCPYRRQQGPPYHYRSLSLADP